MSKFTTWSSVRCTWNPETLLTCFLNFSLLQIVSPHLQSEYQHWVNYLHCNALQIGLRITLEPLLIYSIFLLPISAQLPILQCILWNGVTLKWCLCFFLSPLPHSLCFHGVSHSSAGHLDERTSLPNGPLSGWFLSYPVHLLPPTAATRSLNVTFLTLLFTQNSSVSFYFPSHHPFMTASKLIKGIGSVFFSFVFSFSSLSSLSFPMCLTQNRCWIYT